MKYWWVNQNQTAVQEIEGGYLWSPKLGQNGVRLSAYENMKEIEPGDLVFSYSGKRVNYFGIATDRAMSAPKPVEFKNIGSYWSGNGWCVPIKWSPLNPIERDIIGREAEKLFETLESPFTVSGTVKQAYLFQICKKAADFIMMMGGVPENKYQQEYIELEPSFFTAAERFDELVETFIVQKTDLPSTEKEAVVLARRGQGLFKENLFKVEKVCRITKVDDPKILIASHIKPWRSCESTHERLDGNNGLLLTPTMDKLFDRRFVTFESNGDVVFSKKVSSENFARIGLNTKERLNVGAFNSEQARYLRYHQEEFLG